MKYLSLVLILKIIVFHYKFLSLSGSMLRKEFTMNVTYQNPLEDYDERKKYADEEINFKRRINEVEQKIEADSELLKMILNINNIQIQKLSEIINVNLATLYYKALRFRPKKIELRKPDPTPSVNILSMDSVESFIEKMVRMGKLNRKALNLRPSKYFGYKGAREELGQYFSKLKKKMDDYKLMDWLRKQDTSGYKGDFVSAFAAFGVNYK